LPVEVSHILLEGIPLNFKNYFEITDLKDFSSVPFVVKEFKN